MDNHTIALLIPLAPFIIGGFAIWTRHQRKMAELQVEATAEKAAQYASNSRELEERVRVLERIITDGGYDTALQIEALRDTRIGDQRAMEAGTTEKETRQ
ncbi:hypothetical protein [Novosphingobium clariflavum]|uniref:Phage shock protein B n=1 Tax=Novosphingobium clariflavum TaxID=2029884 RepID=A0ABV6SE37_9SPHN|nr:hypothetical protein [Novosphingobium clariflavum]